jgi:hypothetical protein
LTDVETLVIVKVMNPTSTSTPQNDVTTRPLKTVELAGLLGIPFYRISYLLRSGKIPRPGRDASGHLLWNDREIEQVRRALDRDRRTCPDRTEDQGQG